MRFIDRLSVLIFNIIIDASLILIGVFYAQIEDSHTSMIAILMSSMLILFKDFIFIIWAFVSNSKVKKFYLVFPIILLLLISSSLFAQQPVIGDSATLKDKKNVVYDLVSEMPVFPKGEGNIGKDSTGNAIYPKELQEKKIQGIVYIEFIIDENGNVTNAKILKSSNEPLLDEEALKIVRSLPKWKPGKNNEVPVKVRKVTRIKFTLS